MFGISLEHLLILAVVGLFILGPQRLPEAAVWLGRTTRLIRQYVSGAREQIKAELGPDFDELRDTMGSLNSLRQMNPVTTVRRSLFDADRPAVAPVTETNDSDDLSEGSRRQTAPPTVPPESNEALG